MADLNLTRTARTPAYDELGVPPDTAARFLRALQRADAADVERTLTRKSMTAGACETLRAGYAMARGDAGVADEWLTRYPDLLADDTLTDAELALARLVDAIAETV
ncbi:MAG TPA: hypothetical protein VJ673_11450 [Aromatoleum sp.]|uniref:hypothetical protein n=1 Tax=Aromatoleum sp. TaxID=2307007 RepID=UPI002B49AE5D|nr:hypothetical protein [Aromatoleum sp.]HJV26297.1 hypothetical protein [Aromatoleum sp.]